MTQVPEDIDFPAARRRPPVWLWGLAAVVVAGALVAGGFKLWESRQHKQMVRQRQLLSRLGSTLEEYAKAHGGALPDSPPDGFSKDIATGKALNYRVTTAGGERLEYDFLGNRLLAWSPEPSYRGRRAVLLNDLTPMFLKDDVIDLENQVVLVTDPLNQTVPKLTKADDGDEESDETDDVEDAPITDEPATLPTTTPTTQP